MTTTFVAGTDFASSAAQPFSRVAVAIKIVPKSFMAGVNRCNDKRARCTNGNYRRAHHGRDGRNLRGGNCNPAGKAEWTSPRKTTARHGAVRPPRTRAAVAAKRPRLPARGTHFVKSKGEKRERPEQMVR